jgi:hypothetical protein
VATSELEPMHAELNRMLDETPSVSRVFLCRSKGTKEHVYCGFGLRGVGTGCILIPREKYDWTKLLKIIGQFGSVSV